MALQFTLNRDAAPAAAFDCVVVGAFADKTLTPAGQAIDEASGGRLRSLLERGDLSGRTGRSLVLHDLPGVVAPRVLVVGLGEAAKFGVPQYLKAVAEMSWMDYYVRGSGKKFAWRDVLKAVETGGPQLAGEGVPTP